MISTRPTIALPLRIVIAGEPVAQGRGEARVARFRRPDGSFFHRAIIEDPEKSREFKLRVRTQAALVMRGADPFTCPLVVHIRAVWPCRQSDVRVRDPRPARWRDAIPDGDNVAKGVLDGMEGVVFDNDCRAVRTIVDKFIAPQGLRPCVVVYVSVPPDPETCVTWVRAQGGLKWE